MFYDEGGQRFLSREDEDVIVHVTDIEICYGCENLEVNNTIYKIIHTRRLNPLPPNI